MHLKISFARVQKIVFFGPTDQKLWVFEVLGEVRAAQANQKTFYFLTFMGWIFCYRFLTKFLNILST
jgi:hypothetical protein